MAIPAIHSGEHLAEELKELGMSAAELARRVPTNRVTEILNASRDAEFLRGKVLLESICDRPNAPHSY